MIDQLTVFLSNSKGRLTAMCAALGEANIQMHALALADTTDYGIARIICDDPAAAAQTLLNSGFSASTTKVVAVEVPHVPGGLAKVFGALDNADINIEYSYCFAASEGATVAFKSDDEGVEDALTAAGLKVLTPADLA